MYVLDCSLGADSPRSIANGDLSALRTVNLDCQDFVPGNLKAPVRQFVRFPNPGPIPSRLQRYQTESNNATIRFV
jgi:hypothetical protein